MALKYGPGAVLIPYLIGVGTGEDDYVKDVIYFSPFNFETTTTLNGLTSYITNNMSNGSKWQVTAGIWAADQYREPGDFMKTLVDKEVTLTSTEIGAHELAIIDFDSYTVSPGVYYVGIRYYPNSSPSTSIQLIGGKAGVWPEHNMITGDLSSANVLPERYSQSFGSGMGQGTVTRSAGYCPVIGLRVGA